MLNIILSIFVFFSISFGTSAKANETNRIIHLLLMHEENICQAIFWIELNGERKRFEYKNESKIYNKKKSCLIEIPVSEFDKYFSFCSLSGISNFSRPFNKADNEFSVNFAGGPHHPHDIYYFEWKDARNISPRYSCIGK